MCQACCDLPLCAAALKMSKTAKGSDAYVVNMSHAGKFLGVCTTDPSKTAFPVHFVWQKGEYKWTFHQVILCWGGGEAIHSVIAENLKVSTLNLFSQPVCLHVSMAQCAVVGFPMFFHWPV